MEGYPVEVADATIALIAATGVAPGRGLFECPG
jgi:hypothetical protein